MRKYTIPILLAVLALAAVLAYHTVYTIYTMNSHGTGVAGGGVGGYNLSAASMIRGELYVYVNGRLALYVPNDPPTADTVDAMRSVIAYPYSVSTDYVNYVGLMNLEDAGILIVTQDHPYDQSMRWDAISSDATLLSTDIREDTENGVPVVFYYAKYYVSSETIVYGVGIKGHYRYAYKLVWTSGSNYYVKYYYTDLLLLYDHLPSPLSLSQGDVLVVVYKVSFPRLG